MAGTNRTLQLWRRCLRSCRVMEPAAGSYYRQFAWEHITAHWEEDDPEKLDYLLGKGEESLEWILKKYNIEEPVRQEQRRPS